MMVYLEDFYQTSTRYYKNGNGGSLCNTMYVYQVEMQHGFVTVPKKSTSNLLSKKAELAKLKSMKHKMLYRLH